MRNPPLFRLKQDRRDPVARAFTSQCPACGTVEPTLLTRTVAAVYFGCDLCGHLWNLPKRGQGHVAPLAIEFVQAE